MPLVTISLSEAWSPEDQKLRMKINEKEFAFRKSQKSC